MRAIMQLEECEEERKECKRFLVEKDLSQSTRNAPLESLVLTPQKENDEFQQLRKKDPLSIEEEEGPQCPTERLERGNENFQEKRTQKRLPDFEIQGETYNNLLQVNQFKGDLLLFI